MNNQKLTSEYIKGYIYGSLFHTDSDHEYKKEKTTIQVIDLLNNEFKITIGIDIEQPDIIQEEECHGKKYVYVPSEPEVSIIQFKNKIESLNDENLKKFIIEVWELLNTID